MKKRIVERKLSISKSIMESVGITYERLSSLLIELHSILGNKAIDLIPENINDFSTLHFIVTLSENLSLLKNCEGFGQHIARYTKKQIRSSHFVTELAAFLFSKVETLSLEPIYPNSKMSDISVLFQGQSIYIECKGIETTKHDYSKEHDEFFSILKPIITDIPHEISITYRKELSEDNVRALGTVIRDRTISISSNGRIIDNPDVSVYVTRRDKSNNPSVKLYMSIIQENLDERCRYPGNVYGVDGISLTISGPKVSYKRVFKEKIRRSKSQAPLNSPYILIIDGNLMLGCLSDNIRALATAFQPKVNSRFSSAIIVEHNPRIGASQTDFKFQVVNNPFAKYPVTDHFLRLFK
ncbi:hypothetical protein ACFLUJ_09425 [Chloroflexota bacterium]